MLAPVDEGDDVVNGERYASHVAIGTVLTIRVHNHTPFVCSQRARLFHFESLLPMTMALLSQVGLSFRSR